MTSVWERGADGKRSRGTASFRAYTHDGFWQPMDTLRDKLKLEELWQSGKAPWKVWS